MSTDSASPPGPYDLAVIGGGVNGCGIARDAAGRGLSVLLLEQGDLAAGTSSASSKLIHGGIRYLEHYHFSLVRESLKERDVILNIAPHISRPLCFVFPHNPSMRPMWMIRAGLFLYDHLGGKQFPHSRRVSDFRSDEAGRLLKPRFDRGFEYYDCWTDDARLVVLNARDAALRGAHIMTRTRCTRAASRDGVWSLDVEETGSGARQSFQARQLVNATGPWVSSFLSASLDADLVEPERTVTRNVKGSHLVARKWFDHDRAYILQNHDERVVFVLPFEDDYVLIGTTDVDYEGDPGEVVISDEEQRYLLDCVNDYFNRRINDSDIVRTYAGVRPLYDDGSSKAQETTRDALLRDSTTTDGAGLLNVFGGKLTTFRRLAEDALARIGRRMDGIAPPWTADAPLPGGGFEPSRRDELMRECVARYPFVPEAVATRWFRSYGLDTDELTGGAAKLSDLGHDFGGGLYEAEVAWMVDREWARTTEDVLWRRSKLGLRTGEIDMTALEQWLARHAGSAGERVAMGFNST